MIEHPKAGEVWRHKSGGRDIHIVGTLDVYVVYRIADGPPDVVSIRLFLERYERVPA